MFERSELVQGLAELTDSPRGIPNAQVAAYLRYYGLYPLAAECEYRIGTAVLDGVTTAIQCFQQHSPDAVRGSVIVVHGYMDHMGLYRHLINHLYAQGFNVVAYDLSGHGLSAGDPLDVAAFEHYANQLDELLRILESLLPPPFHLIGQSTGGAVIVAQQRLLAAPVPLMGGQRILLAPLIRPAMWQSIKRRFNWLKYVIRRVPRRYSSSSHDDQFLRFIAEEDPLQHQQIPVRWVGAMLAWGDWLEQQLAIPEALTIIQGDNDRTVDWQYNLLVFKGLYPNLNLHLIADAGHHLVNETEFYREQVFRRIDQQLGIILEKQ